MKSLLATTAVLEFGTGLVLVAIPSAVATFLLGAQLDTPVGLTVARLGGVALLAIGTACWLARLDGQSRVARGLAGAMVIYNVGAVTIFAYAGLALRQSGVGLWPVGCGSRSHGHLVRRSPPRQTPVMAAGTATLSREETRIHVHVAHPDGEAKFWLTPNVHLAVSIGLSPAQIRQAHVVVEAHIQEIQDAWHRHFGS